jgi:hypothetical protein
VNDPRGKVLEERPWCDECGQENRKLTAEWIVPLNRGGKPAEDNVTVVCEWCDSSR